MSAERLQKVLASAGIASRRDSEAIIAAGRVTVNGRVVQEPGLRVDPEQDVVLLDGQPVRQPNERTYLLLHKPVGFVSTADDPHGRPTVVDLVDVPGRVFPVGRLDVDSEGLILLTDDGELTHQLTHPSYEVEKEYRVLLDRVLDADALRQWRSGVTLNGEQTAPATVSFLETTDEGHWHKVVLREGRKRQIREVAKLLGYDALRLIRVREGDLTLGELPLREWRKLTSEEVASLRAHVPARQPESEADAGRRAARAAGAATAGAAGAAYAARGRQDERAPRERRPDERPSEGRDQRGYGADSRGREGYAPRRDERGGPERSSRPDDERGPRAGSDFRRDERPARPYGDERPPERERSDFRRDERPSRPYGDRPARPYGDRPSRPAGDDRGPRAGSDFRRDERPARPYGDRPSRPAGDDRGPRAGNDFRRDERPARPYGDRPSRPAGDDRGPRAGSDFRRDERPARPYDDRPPRQERPDDAPPARSEPRPERAAAPARSEPRPERDESRSAPRPERDESRGAPRPVNGAPRGRSSFRSRPSGRPNFNVRPKSSEDEQA